ncbi:MAG: 3-phosphoshikimate 1-carboxyvinyltransferase, partial [Alphaproteobacteria bacterium]|nr:3-phosphoshikimate 1-carboxyvinyltransferase [Alphaproteobacteria bacterium]
VVHGVGLHGLAGSAAPIDCGNAGTGMRLLAGLLAGQAFDSVLVGDESLSRRPMRRVIEPLVEMGARIEAGDGGLPPLHVRGGRRLRGIRCKPPVASAQVKSAILLAGLNAPGETCVIEPEPTRDHTENMLRHFGATISVDDGADGRAIRLRGQPELRAAPVIVPADPSSAAFAVVAASILPGSEVLIRNVGINPLRTGLFTTLLEMGADIAFLDRREAGGEPVADLLVRGAELRGVEVPAGRAPSMIDEYPVLAIAAACARGETRMLGLGELRVKESDRLSAVAAGLAACGVPHQEGEDRLVVRGDGTPPGGGGMVATNMDHRIAMSFLVLGLRARAPVEIDDARMIDTSFPGFVAMMNGLGARMGAAA